MRLFRFLNFNLQTKTALYFAIGLLGVTLSSLFIIRYFFLVSLDELERTDAEAARKQASSVISMMVTNQEDHSYDWAMWDETHELLSGGDVDAYIERNLMAETLDALNLDLMVFMTLKGDVVTTLSRYEGDSHLDGWISELLTNQYVVGHIKAMNQTLDDKRVSKSGLVWLGDNIWSVSLTPVRNSEGTSASSGWMIWGQNLSARFPGDYSNILTGNNVIERLPESYVSTEDGHIHIDKSATTLTEWSELIGLSGQPIAALCTQIERTHYIKGSQLFKYLLAAFVAATTVISLITLLLFRKKVAIRFSDLEKNIEELFSTHQLERSESKSKDELDLLTHLLQALSSNTSTTQERLKDTLQKFEALYQSRNIAMVLVRDREIIDINQTALELLEYEKEDVLQHPLDLLCPDNEDQPECQVDIMYREFNRGKKHFEACVLTSKGEQVECTIETTLIQHEGEDAIMLAIQDQREKKLQEQLIETLSERDYLSELSNRKAIFDKANSFIISTPNQFSFIYISIPRLKVVSEVFGNQIFDDAIRYIASMFVNYLPQFQVGRISVHEFVVLIPDYKACEEAVHGTTRVLDELSSKKQILGVELDLSAQAAMLDPEITHEELDYLLQAAVYAVQNEASKESTLKIIKVGSEIFERAKLSSDICRELPNAIREQQIVAYYQPIVDTKTGEINGFEALARWLHPTLGIVSPGVFIPLAEQNNLEIELGESIIEQACQFIEKVNTQRGNANLRPVTVHVNLSSTHFYHTHLVKYLEEVTAQHQVQAGQLVVEMTESMLMGVETEVISRMEEIKSLGIQLALDDFGTGYSSFSTLCSFPLDIVKLDKSYIDQLDQNERAKILIRNIVKMAQELGLTTVAEGVETASQVRKLRNWNIEEIQGFYFYKPMPVEEAFVIAQR